MAFQETIIAFGTTVNAEIEALAALAPTSLTTRTGYGRPKVIAFGAVASTDDVEKVWCVPSAFADSNGFGAPYVNIYAAANSTDWEQAKLQVPIELPENCALTINAQSETAANSVVFAWMLLEYPNGGKMNAPQAGPSIVRRAWEHGAALVSNTIAASTAITDLAAGTQYQPIAVGHGGVNGATAGCVGPWFIRFDNPEMEGANLFVPVPNNAGYSAAGGIGILDFGRLGIKMPSFSGGVNFRTSAIGYTAEQPQAEILFAVNKKLFP